MPFAILATRFSFQQLLITAIHPNRPQRRSDQNSKYGHRQYDLSAGEAHGHWDGADGGLDGCFGQVGDGAEQFFFCGQIGSDYAEGDAKSSDQQGGEDHSQGCRTCFQGIADIYGCTHKHEKQDFSSKPKLSQFLLKTGGDSSGKLKL